LSKFVLNIWTISLNLTKQASMKSSVLYEPEKLRITFFSDNKPTGGMIGKCAVKKARKLKLTPKTKKG